MIQRIGWLWGLLALAVVGIVAAIAYHAGQTATLVTTTAPPGGTTVYSGYYHDGFGFFWLFPLLFFLFIFFAIRRSVGWGRGCYGHGGHWHDHGHDHGPGHGHADQPGQPPSGSPDQRPGA